MITTLVSAICMSIPRFPERYFHGEITIDVIGHKEYKRVAEVAWDGDNTRSMVKWVKDFEDVAQHIIRRYDLRREYDFKEVCVDEVCEKMCSKSSLEGHTFKRPVVLDTATQTSCPAESEDFLTWTTASNHTLITHLNHTIASMESSTLRWSIKYFSTEPSASGVSFTVPHSFNPKTLCKPSPNDNGLPYVHFFSDILTL
eukprot:TRINITY_DN2605_c0_g1_i1.p1 TRINITY_DN2605_c0_g1~~TRINITY_DN2605_c0_g1_i1.p1  ORF type:complete len:213 (+),score=28.57 TRINITY_DN2605_c0_g1_i1:42-641(+)